jgi:hypothetical protein
MLMVTCRPLPLLLFFAFLDLPTGFSGSDGSDPVSPPLGLGGSTGNALGKDDFALRTRLDWDLVGATAAASASR